MATAAVIQYLRLDTTNDPIFDPLACQTDIDAVAQAILTTILLFQGEWWETLAIGTPMFQSILGASGSPASQKAITLALTQRIASVPYVQAVLNVSTSFDSARGFDFSADVQTAFGPVTVSSLGAASQLG